MLTSHDRLLPNSKEVAAKVLDGEAILINLSNGMYYSMDKVGGLLWELITEGHSLGEIAETIVSHYDVSLDRARADVERLAEELLRERLVIVSRSLFSPSGCQSVQPPNEALSYESPALNIYRDMGDLLALDPPMPGLTDIPWKESSGGSHD